MVAPYRYCRHLLAGLFLALAHPAPTLASDGPDWPAIDAAEDALLLALDDEILAPDARRCRQAAQRQQKLAGLAPQALVVPWLDVACARARGEYRKAARLQKRLERAVRARHEPTPEATIDLRLTLHSSLDARALAGIYGRSMREIEFRLSSDWARIEWLALYESEEGRELRILFDATELSISQLRRNVQSITTDAERKHWLHLEMAVFPAWWMFQSWRHAEPDEQLIAAAAAWFAARLGEPVQDIRRLADIALGGHGELFRVRHAYWLLEQRHGARDDGLAKLSESLFGGGELELDKQLLETLQGLGGQATSDALALLAALSHHGIAVPKSQRQRDRYLQVYADRRSAAEADYALADLLLLERLGLADAAEARLRLLAAAQAGLHRAWSRLAEHCGALPVQALPAECAADRLEAGVRAASAAGDGPSTRLLGEALLDQKPFPERKASRLWELAARQGDRYAPWYQVSTWEGAGDVSVGQWRDVLWLGLRRGDVSALHALGAVYQHGHGVTPDLPQACFWFERASERHHVRAMRALADLLAAGDCPVDAPTAREQIQRWLELAGSLGSDEALLRLADLSRGWEGPHRLAQARDWYEQAVEMGNEQAQIHLAWMCERGDGGPVDGRCAFRNFQAWARRGDPAGINNLGRMYLHGIGIAANPVQAVKLFRQAAEAGSHHAQCNLGEWLLDQTAQADQDEGRALIRKAAEAGNTHCRVRLGQALAYGLDGVEPDPKAATGWLEKAATANADGEIGAEARNAWLEWLTSRHNPARDVARARDLLDGDPLRNCRELAETWLGDFDLAAAVRSLEDVAASKRPGCNTLLARLLTFHQPDAAGLARASALLADLPAPLSDEGRLVRARIALHRQQPDIALEDLAVLKDDWPLARYWLARLCHQRKPCPLTNEAAATEFQALKALQGVDGNNLAFELAADPLVDREAGRFALDLVRGLSHIDEVAGWLDTRACAEARVGDLTAARRTAAAARAQAAARGAPLAFFDQRIALLAAGHRCDHPF